MLLQESPGNPFPRQRSAYALSSCVLLSINWNDMQELRRSSVSIDIAVREAVQVCLSFPLSSLLHNPSGLTLDLRRPLLGCDNPCHQICQKIRPSMFDSSRQYLALDPVEAKVDAIDTKLEKMSEQMSQMASSIAELRSARTS